MIKRAPANGAIKVTFALPVDDVDQAVSVVGDFNAWDPMAHPLRKRSNGTRSVSVELPAGEAVRFMGTRRGLETRLVPEAGFELLTLNSRPIVGRGVFEQIHALLALFGATFRALRGLRDFGQSCNAMRDLERKAGSSEWTTSL